MDLASRFRCALVATAGYNSSLLFPTFGQEHTGLFCEKYISLFPILKEILYCYICNQYQKLIVININNWWFLFSTFLIFDLRGFDEKKDFIAPMKLFLSKVLLKLIFFIGESLVAIVNYS